MLTRCELAIFVPYIEYISNIYPQQQKVIEIKTYFSVVMGRGRK